MDLEELLSRVARAFGVGLLIGLERGWHIRRVIAEAHAAVRRWACVGRLTEHHPEFAAVLVECGIDSISVSPDSFIAVKHSVAAAEKETAAA